MKLRTLIATLALSTTALVSARAEVWVGKQLPADNLEYFDGAKSYKGQPAIVEFWATWCEPCKVWIPHLNAVYKKYKGKGLAVVGVSLDLKKSDVEQFRKTNPMEYTVAYDDEQKYAGTLLMPGLPYAYVVDRTGKVVWEGFTGELKAETIESVLK
jgi:thiol-disulfide isomerase/thioredoxin